MSLYEDMLVLLSHETGQEKVVSLGISKRTVKKGGKEQRGDDQVRCARLLEGAGAARGARDAPEAERGEGGAERAARA